MISRLHTCRFLAWMLASVLAFAGGVSARAAEDADLYNQLMRRYDVVNDEISKTLADLDYESPMPGYPERLLSLRKNAEVVIGGEIRTTWAGSKAKWDDPGFAPGESAYGQSESKAGDLALHSAKLLVDARAGRWRAYFDLDLNLNHGFRPLKQLRNPNAPGGTSARYETEERKELIYQAFIEMFKDGHSGFGFKAGQMELPFGLDARPKLFAQGFMDSPNLTGSYLMSPLGWHDRGILPHASRFLDPVLAALISYEMRDIVRFEAAVFQETDNDVVVSDGGRRYRTKHEAPRSWQVGFSLLPLEGWELTAHFRNRHSRSMGIDTWIDSPSRWGFRENLAVAGGNPHWDGGQAQWVDGGDGPGFGAQKNEQAVIVGVAVEIPNTNLSVTAEYAHGWNQGFNKYIDSENVNVGLAYRATPRLTLHAQGEWLYVKDRSWMAENSTGWERDTRNNHLYRAMLGAQYELARGLTLEAGWQYEYWRQRSTVLDEKKTNTAHMIYFGTRFIF